MLINMVEAGEISGQLDLVFKRMAIQFEKENKLNQKNKRCTYISDYSNGCGNSRYNDIDGGCCADVCQSSCGF